jgi:ABC-type Fe3+/spermidine/putrescine transport system ATPase subunit
VRGWALRVSDLTVRYGSATIIDGITLEVSAGESVAILGPSGSGKTTLLYAIAGFVAPHAGEIRIDEEVVADAQISVAPERRSIGFVFQNYALWPHLTARETVAYPLRRGGVDMAAARREAAELLRLVGIPELGERRPAELSGGQQQRVGLARALARRPDLYLFDEPTAHLDSDLRSALQEELVARRRAEGAAALYATHDAAEALAVADRVVVLRAGRVVQTGTPREIYDRPADLWAARLTGPAWILEATVLARDDNRLTLAVGEARVVVPLASRPLEDRVGLVIRPDWVGPGDELPGTVTGAWYRGPHTDYRIETAGGLLEMRRPGAPAMAVGDAVGLQIVQAWPVENP